MIFFLSDSGSNFLLLCIMMKVVKVGDIVFLPLEKKVPSFTIEYVSSCGFASKI